MTWHILRKDLEQLWILVLIAAISQFANSGLWFALDHFQEPAELIIAARVFPIIVWVAIALLIMTCVHQDSVPGVSQDWLIRPIRRGDLLKAKVVFLLVAVNGPMFLADFTHAVAAGFAIRDSLQTAVVHGLLALVVLELPILALGTITTTLTEAIGAMLAIWLIVLAVVLAGTAMRGGTPPPFAMSGMQWMTPAFWTLLAIAAASIIIPLQYFGRTTSRSRRIAATVTILAPMLSFLSWTKAFGFQQWISNHPQTAGRVTVSFTPGAEGTAQSAATLPANTLLLPLTVSGLPPESLVLSDRADIRLTGKDGNILYSGRTVANPGYHGDFVVNTAVGGSVKIFQQIALPQKTYALIGNRSVRAQIDYSLTLFRWQVVDTIRAVDGNKRIAGLGWCKTRIDPDGDEIQLGCLEVSTVPTCISLQLENPENGKQNPVNLICTPDYAPYRLHLYPDALGQFGGGVRFGDPQGFARFPVDGMQLAEARVTVRSYEPTAHFTRLLIADVQPADWVTQNRMADVRP